MSSKNTILEELYIKSKITKLFPNADLKISDSGYVVINRIPKARQNEKDFEFYISTDGPVNYTTSLEAWQKADSWIENTLSNPNLHKDTLIFDLSEAAQEHHLYALNENKNSIEEDINNIKNSGGSDFPDEDGNLLNWMESNVSKLETSMEKAKIIFNDVKKLSFGPVTLDDLHSGRFTLALSISETNKHFETKGSGVGLGYLPYEVLKDIFENKNSDIDLKIINYQTDNVSITQSVTNDKLENLNNAHLYPLQYADALKFMQIKHPKRLQNIQKKNTELLIGDKHIHKQPVFLDFTKEQKQAHLKELISNLTSNIEYKKGIESIDENKQDDEDWDIISHLGKEIEILKTSISDIEFIEGESLRPLIGEELANFLEEVYAEKDENLIDSFNEVTEEYKFHPEHILSKDEINLIEKHKEAEFLSLSTLKYREHVAEIKTIYDKVKKYSDNLTSDDSAYNHMEVRALLHEVKDAAKESSNIEFDLDFVGYGPINKNDLNNGTFVLLDSNPKDLAMVYYANKYTAMIQFVKNDNLMPVSINDIEPINQNAVKEILKNNHKERSNIIKSDKNIKMINPKFRLEPIFNKNEKKLVFQIQKKHNVFGWKELNKPLKDESANFNSLAEGFNKLTELQINATKKIGKKI